MENQTESTAQEVPNQTPVEQPTEVNKPSILSSKWLKIGGVVLFVILVLAGTFVAGAKLMNKTQAPSPTPTVARTATPTPDPTATWKTYSNANYGFSFQYPSYLATIDDKFPKEIPSAGTVSDELRISSADYKNDLQIYINPHFGGMCSGVFIYKASESGSGLVFTKTKGDNSNLPGGSTCSSFYEVRIDLGNGNYLNANFSYDSKNTNAQADFEKILSTFKFTGSSSNLKTYTDSQFGFSFQYPSTWITTTAFNPTPPYVKLNLGLIQVGQSAGSSVTPIYVMQYDNPSNLSVNDWQNDYNKNLPLQHAYYSPTDTQMTVGNMKAYVNQKAGCEPYLCYQTIVMAKANVFMFYNVNLDGAGTGQNFAANQKIYDGVISSLKFNQ